MQKKLTTKQEQELIEEGFIDWMENMPEKGFDLSKDKDIIFLEFYERLLGGDFKEEESTKSSNKKIAKAFLKSYYNAEREDEILPYIDKEAWKIKYKESFPFITKFVNEYFADEKVEITNIDELRKTLAVIAANKLSKVYGSCIQINNTKNKIVDTGFKLAITRSLLDMGYVEQADFLVGGPQTEINEKYQPLILTMYINTANSFMRHHNGLRRKMEDNKYDLVWNSLEQYLKNCESLLTDKTKQDPTFKKVKAEIDEYIESKHQLREHYTLSGIYGDYYNTVLSCVKRFKAGENTPEDKEIVSEFLNRTQEINKALAYKDSHGRGYACNYFVYTNTPPMSMLYLMGEFSKNIPDLSPNDVKMITETKSLIRKAFGDKIKNRQTIQSYHDALHMFQFKTTEHDLTKPENFDKFANEVAKRVDKYHLPKTELCVQIVGADVLKGKEPVKVDELENAKSAIIK